MATRKDSTPEIPPRREALGRYTAKEVAWLYGIDAQALAKMRERGVLHASPSTGTSHPLYYRRDELDAAVCGGAL